MEHVSGVPRSLEIFYESGAGGKGWAGHCPSFPALVVTADSLLQVDLALMPLLTSALVARHDEAVAVNVLPGGETPLGDGSYRKIVAVVPASTSCSMPFFGA